MLVSYKLNVRVFPFCEVFLLMIININGTYIDFPVNVVATVAGIISSVQVCVFMDLSNYQHVNFYLHR